MNTFDGNEAWNNFTSGLNLFNQSQPAGMYPSMPSGNPDTALEHDVVPLAFSDNVVAGNVIQGFEIWSVKRTPYKHVIAGNNGQIGIFAANSDRIGVYLQNPVVVCEVGTKGIGIHSSGAYVGSFEVDQGGQIAGCAIGLHGGGGATGGMRLTGTVLQNEVNIDELTVAITLTDVRHLPLATFPHRYILFPDHWRGIDGAVWDGVGPSPKLGISMFLPDRGSSLVVKNWQGTGQDYRLFYQQSLGSNPVWPSNPWPDNYNPPVAGLTMQQAWDTYGLGFAGDVLKASEAVPLDGILNGLARPGLGVSLGPPRAVCTFPTLRAPAIVESGYVRITCLLTGDYTAASPVMMLSVDGNGPYALVKNGTDDRLFPTDHTSPGIHEVKVWRTQKANPTVAIPGSEYTSQYCIGSCPTLSERHKF